MQLRATTRCMVDALQANVSGVRTLISTCPSVACADYFLFFLVLFGARVWQIATSLFLFLLIFCFVYMFLTNYLSSERWLRCLQNFEHSFLEIRFLEILLRHVGLMKMHCNCSLSRLDLLKVWFSLLVLRYQEDTTIVKNKVYIFCLLITIFERC